MPVTWSNITIDNNVGGVSASRYQADRVVKAAGVLWAVFINGSNSKVQVRSSSDGGVTWGAAEDVWTPTTPSAQSSWSLGIIKDTANNVPVVVAATSDAAGLRVRVFRRDSGSWVAKGTVTPSAIQGTSRYFILQHQSTTTAWMLIYADGSTSKYAISTNDLTSFGTVTTLASNGNNSAIDTRGNMHFKIDSAGAILGFMGLNNGVDRIYEASCTSAWSGGTATWTTTDRSSNFGGPWSTAQGPRSIYWTYFPGTTDIQLAYAVYVSGANNNGIHTRKRTSGTWGSNNDTGFVDGSHNPDIRVMIYPDNTWRLYAVTTTGTFERITMLDKTSGSWVTTHLLSESKDQSRFCVLDGSGGTQAAGDFIMYDNVQDADVKVFESSDLLIGLYQKTITNTIRFFQTLSLQGFIIRNILNTTVTRVQGGGRQIVKTAAGVLWHCYYEGGSVKVAYSSDNGYTWTVTVVGPTWVPAGMAMCIGSGDVPVLVLTRPSNDDFYIYLWNGSSWVLKKQLNEPVAESGSFQIMWTGSTYIMVYAYITSTSDRRVYSRTSADLITWAAGVLVKNGDGSGTGPHVYRRVAACLDSSGNVHAVYSIRSSSVHKLYYRKYSGGAWGTEELIATGYGGNNITDFHSGLSVAVDDRGYVHLVCRVRGTTYTGRVRHAYFRREAAWGAVEYIHSEVDDDQDYASLSLNLRTPVVCWASTSLGLGVTCAKRGSDGTWSYNQITANTRDSVQTVHGPGYGSSLNYTRGVVGSMRGSEEYFYSTDIISGNAAAMETTIAFSSILSTQRRVMSNTITFTCALSAVRSLTLRSTINFEGRLNYARTMTLQPASINFSGVLTGVAGVLVEPVHQHINFTSTLTGVKSPTKSLAHTINFTSRLNRVISATVTNNIAFSGAFVVNIIKRQAFSNTINFMSRLTYNARLNKFMAHVLSFISRMVAMKGDEGCQPVFTPDRPLPTSEDDVNVVYLIGPLPLLSLTVQLKRPEYGNTRRQGLQVKANRTRGGKLRVHARTPTYEPQTITFESLSYLKLEQVRNFLRVTKGKKIYYLDEKNRKWIGYITNSDIDLTEEARDRGGVFTLDFEGVLAS